jgi:hypothetical protein
MAAATGIKHKEMTMKVVTLMKSVYFKDGFENGLESN